MTIKYGGFELRPGERMWKLAQVFDTKEEFKKWLQIDNGLKKRSIPMELQTFPIRFEGYRDTFYAELKRAING